MAISITITTGQSKKNIDALTTSLDAFGRAVTSAHKRLSTLNAKFARLQQVTSGVSPAMAGVAGKANQLTGSYNQLNRQVSTAATASTKHSKSLAGLLPHVVAVTASYMAMRKMLRGVVDALKSAIDFEHRMTIVGAVSRASAEEMVALGQAARDAGESTVWTATESATALKYLAMAGFDAQQSIGALGGVLQIAMIGEMDLGRATDIVTDVLNSMQLQISDLSRVNDVFVGTITRSNTNIEQLGHAFQYVGPIAGELGYSIEEVSAMLGTLAQAGIKGGKAGRNLAQILVKNVDAARVFGMEGAKVNDVLKEMLKRETSVTEMKKRFGMVSLKSALILRSHLDDYKNFAETLNHVTGEADALANKVEKDLLNQFKLLRSAVDETTKSVFDLFKEDLRDAIGDATEWVRENKEAVVDFFKKVKEYGSIAANAFNRFSNTVRVGLELIVDYADEHEAVLGMILGGVIAGPLGVAVGATSEGRSGFMGMINKAIEGWDELFTAAEKYQQLKTAEKWNAETAAMMALDKELFKEKGLIGAYEDLGQISDEIVKQKKKENAVWENIYGVMKKVGEEVGKTSSYYNEFAGVSSAVVGVVEEDSEEVLAVIEEFRLDKLALEEKIFADSFKMQEKANEKRIAAEKKANEDMLAVMEEFRLDKLQREEDEFAASFEDQEAAIQKRLDAEKKANENMEKAEKKYFDDIGALAETQLTAVFQGEFESIGGFFKDMLNNMYSMFVSWISQIAAQKIVFPVVMSVVGGATAAFAGTNGGASGGLSLSNLLSGASLANGWNNFSTGMSGGFQQNIASFFGNSNNLAVQDFGMGLSNMNPMMFNPLLAAGFDLLMGGNIGSAAMTAGGTALGTMAMPFMGPLAPLGPILGAILPKIVSSIFGGGHKPKYVYHGSTGGLDEAGNFIPGFDNHGVNPASYSYTGSYYSAGGKHTDASFDQAVVPLSTATDQLISDVLSGYSDWFGNIADTLPKGMETEFLDKLKSIDFSWDFSGDDVSPDEESLQANIEGMLANLNETIWAAYGDALGNYASIGIQEQMAQYGITIDRPNLDTSSMENFQASVTELNDEFTALITAVDAVAPAFDELLGSLSSATSEYFGNFQSIDSMIAEAGGVDYRGVDAQWQADTYKLLFENAVTNGSPMAMQLGLQYGQSLVAMAPYAHSDYDLAGDLESIRESMKEVMGSPQDFYTQIQDSIDTFVAGMQGGLDNLVAAINNLHPELNMENIKVDVTVVHDEPSGATVTEVGGDDGLFSGGGIIRMPLG